MGLRKVRPVHQKGTNKVVNYCVVGDGLLKSPEFATVGNDSKQNAKVLQRFAIPCDIFYRFAEVCNSLQLFSIACTSLQCFLLLALSKQFTGIIDYHFSTGTSSTCGLPKVLKAERSTSLVSHLENFDPVKINKCTCLKFATQS